MYTLFSLILFIVSSFADRNSGRTEALIFSVLFALCSLVAQYISYKYPQNKDKDEPSTKANYMTYDQEVVNRNDKS